MSYKKVILLFIVGASVGRSAGGCAYLRLCCTGRNLSCVATETPTWSPRTSTAAPPFLARRSTRFAPLRLENAVGRDWQSSAGHLRLEQGDGVPTSDPLRPSTVEPRRPKKQWGYKLLFGTQLHGLSNVSETINYVDSEPVIRYVILNEQLPVSVERVSELRTKRSYARCYCDEQCQQLDDCCSDYERACPPVDCAVEPWSPWTSCAAAARCGAGERRRQRRVLNAPVNNGQRCPTLLERTACDVRCSRADVALLLGYEHNAARRPRRDAIYYDLPAYAQSLALLESYCVVYEAVWTSPHCDSGVRQLSVPKAKSLVCVECQPAVQLHHDFRCANNETAGNTTFWSRVGARNCYGSWVHKFLQRSCTCDRHLPNFDAFLFV